MRNIHSLYDYFTTIFDKFQYRNEKKYRLVFIFFVITSDNDNLSEVIIYIKIGPKLGPINTFKVFSFYV